MNNSGSREDDFRDYEQRDIRDGWPYSDEDVNNRTKRNVPYGRTDANPDQPDNSGMEISTDPAAHDVDGAPLPFADNVEDVVADDDIEERLAQLLENDERVDPQSIDITIHDHIAHIEGAVDSEADRQHLVGLVRAMRGVRDVHAHGLVARGVDSHIPRDTE